MAWVKNTDAVFFNFCDCFSARRTSINKIKTKCEKQANIHFLWPLNCFLEFSVFLVSVLNEINV
jgi:hypothetical protein